MCNTNSKGTLTTTLSNTPAKNRACVMCVMCINIGGAGGGESPPFPIVIDVNPWQSAHAYARTCDLRDWMNLALLWSSVACSFGVASYKIGRHVYNEYIAEQTTWKSLFDEAQSVS